MQSPNNHGQPLDVDVKEEIAHFDGKRTAVTFDTPPALANIAAELEWARGLNEDEFAAEQKKLLRKVSVFLPT